jgi:hypothetical protein
LEQKEAFVIRLYQNRVLDNGSKLKEVATSVKLPYQYFAHLKIGGKYP